MNWQQSRSQVLPRGVSLTTLFWWDDLSVGALLNKRQQSGEDSCRLELDAGNQTQMFDGNLVEFGP
jgi:hypothetical protein